jgi:hypothetical protein
MKTKSWISVLLACCALSAPLQAEIEQITITWNAFKCQDLCIPLIARSFGGIPEVNNKIEIDAPSGSAVMGWNPNYPFNYEPFRYAASMVGISIESMRIRVRGTISSDYENVYLISNGDDARFLLIGPLHSEPGRYMPVYNLASYPLAPEVRDRLIQAEKHRLTVVISGPLYEPGRFPRTLITEQIRVLEPNHMDVRYRR